MTRVTARLSSACSELTTTHVVYHHGQQHVGAHYDFRVGDVILDAVMGASFGCLYSSVFFTLDARRGARWPIACGAEWPLILRRPRGLVGPYSAGGAHCSALFVWRELFAFGAF